MDVVGNALDLYDSIGWWDDANHLVNWCLLSSELDTAYEDTLGDMALGLGGSTIAAIATARVFAATPRPP